MLFLAVLNSTSDYFSTELPEAQEPLKRLPSLSVTWHSDAQGPSSSGPARDNLVSYSPAHATNLNQGHAALREQGLHAGLPQMSGMSLRHMLPALCKAGHAGTPDV